MSLPEKVSVANLIPLSSKDAGNGILRDRISASDSVFHSRVSKMLGVLNGRLPELHDRIFKSPQPIAAFIHGNFFENTTRMQEAVQQKDYEILRDVGINIPQAWINTTRMQEAVQQKDYETLRRLGINVTQAWIDDIVRSLITEGKTIESNTFSVRSPDVMQAQRGFNQYTTSIYSLLSEIAPVQQPRAVIRIENLDENGYRYLDPENDNVRIVRVVSSMLEQGLIPQDTIPGQNVVFSAETEEDKNVDRLINALRASPAGKVIHGEGSSQGVYFKPANWFIETCDLPNVYADPRIYLRFSDDESTSVAREATGFFDSNADSIVHIPVCESDDNLYQRELYMLLKAVNMTSEGHYHPIFIDTARVTPDMATYIIGSLLKDEVESIATAHDKFTKWRKFDSFEYAWRNYGKTILPEDKKIIRRASEVLKLINFHAKNALEEGSGTNLYPAMLLAPYIDKITLDEYVQANRDFLIASQNGTIEEPFLSMWKKFESFMVEVGGAQYIGAEDKIKKTATVHYGNIFALPFEEYDFITSNFVAESITESRMEFRDAIQSLCNSLTPDGIIMQTLMVGSKGYPAGEGTHFPALDLSIEDIEQAYREANMEAVVIPIEDDGEKAREGYHGMALVFARKRGSTTGEKYFSEHKSERESSLTS